MHNMANVIDKVLEWVLGAPAHRQRKDYGKLVPARVPALSPRQRVQLERRRARPVSLGRPERRSPRLWQ